jgi:hypothetical protein
LRLRADDLREGTGRVETGAEEVEDIEGTVAFE